MKRSVMLLLCVPALIVVLSSSPALSCQSEHEAVKKIESVTDQAVTVSVMVAASTPESPVKTDIASAVKATFRTGAAVTKALFKAAASVAATMARSVVHSITSGDVAMSGDQESAKV